MDQRTLTYFGGKSEENALAQAYAERMNGERLAAIQAVPESSRAFFGVETWRKDNTEIHDALLDHLREGGKPSDFIREKMAWIFGPFVAKSRRESLLYAVDACNRYPYSPSLTRRSLRSSDYRLYFDQICATIQAYYRHGLLDMDVCDILEGKLPKDVRAYVKVTKCSVTAQMIAYELDHGNARLEQILEDAMLSEGIPISHALIIGIVQSSNHRMHEMLGKLLLAARLQEGLRQAICELADQGTIEAFMLLIDVIRENDLIRFSAVKRAVGVWLGLMTEETRDLERISAKTLDLVHLYLHDEAARKAALGSEDAMAIYVALWAYGVFDVKEAIATALKLALEGSAHQALVAAYFAGELNEKNLSHELSKRILKRFPDRQDILAACSPHFLPEIDYLFSHRQEKKPLRLTDRFADAEEARWFYDHFVHTMSSMKKRKLLFSPCVFPWNSAELDKAWVTSISCLLAVLIGDSKMIKSACGWISATQNHSRSEILYLVAGNCQMQEQRAAVLNALGDKDSFTRASAMELTQKFTPDAQEIGLLEDMLRFKADDVRERILQLLLRQDEMQLIETISRLLEDKLEERRCAGLDLMLQISKDDSHAAMRGECLRIARKHENAQGKERVLLGNVLDALADEQETEEEFEEYAPDVEKYMNCPDAIDAFMRYFPDSDLCDRFAGSAAKPIEQVISDSAKQAMDDIADLERLIDLHKDDAYTDPRQGESRVLGYGYSHAIPAANRNEEMPLAQIWEQWYTEKINSPERLMRMAVLVCAYRMDQPGDLVLHQQQVERLIGYGLTRYAAGQYWNIVPDVVSWLYSRFVPPEDVSRIAKAACLYVIRLLRDEEMRYYLDGTKRCWYVIASHPQIALLTARICGTEPEQKPDEFEISVAFLRRCEPFYKELAEITWHPIYGRMMQSVPRITLFAIGEGQYVSSRVWIQSIGFPDTAAYIRACREGLITEKQILGWMLDSWDNSEKISELTEVSAFYHSQGNLFMSRSSWGESYRRTRAQRNVEKLIGKADDLGEAELAMLAFADGICQKVINIILEDEFKRSEMDGKYSGSIGKITALFGVQRLIQILAALGKDKLVRSEYSYGTSRRENLCKLLAVCVPDAGDTPELLRRLAKEQGISQKRLIEAAMYAPEWIEMVGKALDINGFDAAAFYFIAHMNDRLGERRMARVAKYTPLSEDELRDGAFDADWFKQVFENVGEELFNQIYDAAKYITDGAKHVRARRYADAVIGRIPLQDAEKAIMDKRNKEMIVAYSLIPLLEDEEVSRRYLFLQEFLKSSKGFGAQRMASEKKLVNVSLRCLALNAGYADVTRLTMRMEARMVEDRKALFAPHAVGDVTVHLQLDEEGKASIVCQKDGKALKSIPARIKKDPYVVELAAAQKEFTAQQARTRRMLEEAMEDETVFTAGEIEALACNPVIEPMLRSIVFKADKGYGYLCNGIWRDCSGSDLHLESDAMLIIAHPWHLWHDGVWADHQAYLFSAKIVQPFKQVFRELYVKTEEERSMLHSLRYAGNQIQPKKTVAALKSRRWIADVEAGLQKVYYRENIIATIYAMADWFTPADIEAPTLEYVQFYHRKTGEVIRIEDVPEVIFSEVMRDVDLAVSVAHVGEVDPMTSYSTIEVRAALLKLTLPLFGLENVRVEGSHALVAGKRAQYSIHLGSGVVHQQGGTMLNVLPIHSQHRGKLFLPFADENPKTAEIISKVLLFAEDQNIKDPTILSQSV